MKHRKPKAPKEGKYSSLHSGLVKTNADIFGDRGDPWVSQRDGMTQYGRNLDTEDVDYDALFRARKAEAHPEPKPQRGKVRVHDPAVRQAFIRHKLRVSLARAARLRGEYGKRSKD